MVTECPHRVVNLTCLLRDWVINHAQTLSKIKDLHCSICDTDIVVQSKLCRTIGCCTAVFLELTTNFVTNLSSSIVDILTFFDTTIFGVQLINLNHIVTEVLKSTTIRNKVRVTHLLVLIHFLINLLNQDTSNVVLTNNRGNVFQCRTQIRSSSTTHCKVSRLFLVVFGILNRLNRIDGDRLDRSTFLNHLLHLSVDPVKDLQWIVGLTYNKARQISTELAKPCFIERILSIEQHNNCFRIKFLDLNQSKLHQ